MLTLVLWQHVVFLCVSRTVFRMSLVMVVRRVLCSVRLHTLSASSLYGSDEDAIEKFQRLHR